jgi:hypothetical protein
MRGSVIKQLMADNNADMAAIATISVSMIEHDAVVDAIATTVVSINVSHSEVIEEDIVWYSR